MRADLKLPRGLLAVAGGAAVAGITSAALGMSMIILGTLELLTESTVPLEPAEVDELLISAHGEANHLLHVVGNLHARSRLDRAILQPDAVPTDLRTITDRAVARAPRVARRCSTSPGSCRW